MGGLDTLLLQEPAAVDLRDSLARLGTEADRILGHVVESKLKQAKVDAGTHVARVGIASAHRAPLWRVRAKDRPRCGARTRKGTPCQMAIVEGKRRCRLHGGMSTGPKTPEGRARIAESNRRRAAARRERLSVD